MDRAPGLLAQEPSIEKVDVLASKLPWRGRPDFTVAESAWGTQRP